MRMFLLPWSSCWFVQVFWSPFFPRKKRIFLNEFIFWGLIVTDIVNWMGEMAHKVIHIQGLLYMIFSLVKLKNLGIGAVNQCFSNNSFGLSILLGCTWRTFWLPTRFKLLRSGFWLLVPLGCLGGGWTFFIVFGYCSDCLQVHKPFSHFFFTIISKLLVVLIISFTSINCHAWE